MKREEFQKAYAKLVAKAWEDDDFKARLFAEPVTVFKENGIEMPEGVEVRLVENTAARVHLILPAKPDGELNDEDLNNVSGGGGVCAVFCRQRSCAQPPPGSNICFG